jgi:hypothetical protein
MAEGPRFVHLDDLPWEEVRKIDFGDHTASVREKWPEFSPKYLTVYAKYDPGMLVHEHGHNGDHVVFVIEGSVRCGGRECPAGTHIALDHGDTFGPFIAGPEGATLFEIMIGDPRSWATEEGEARWAALLEEHGATQAPNPKIALPDWLEDTRT